MTGPAILGYDYGLLLELVAMGYVENALQKANPYKKNLQIWKETGLTFIDPITPATQSLPCKVNFHVELSEISKKPGSSNVSVWPIGWDWGRLVPSCYWRVFAVREDWLTWNPFPWVSCASAYLTPQSSLTPLTSKHINSDWVGVWDCGV